MVQCALRDEMEAMIRRRPVSDRKTYAGLERRLEEAREQSKTGTVGGLEDGEALLKALVMEVEIHAGIEACRDIECATDAHRPDMERLDSAINRGKLLMADSGLVSRALARANRLLSEVEIANAMEEPLQSAVVDEDGEPVDGDAAIYKLSDGSEFNSTVAGEKLACWERRRKRLVEAVEHGVKFESYPELVETAKTALQNLEDELGKVFRLRRRE